MPAPDIIAIAALGKETRYIGYNDELLWRIPADLQRLKSLTKGHPLIMGRKTYESIGRPLPHRTSIILTRDPAYTAPAECIVVTNPDEALARAAAAPGGDDKIFIFGGAEIYTLFLRYTTTLLLTLVSSDQMGTARFPAYSDTFTQTASEPIAYHAQDGEKIPYQWVTYRRNGVSSST